MLTGFRKSAGVLFPANKPGQMQTNNFTAQRDPEPVVAAPVRDSACTMTKQ